MTATSMAELRFDLRCRRCPSLLLLRFIVLAGLAACSSEPIEPSPVGGLLEQVYPWGGQLPHCSGVCVSRGAAIPWTVTSGTSECADAAVQIEGTWTVGAQTVSWYDRARVMPVADETRLAGLTSGHYFVDGWRDVETLVLKDTPSAFFEGSISLSAPATWDCAPQRQPIQLQLLTTWQLIDVAFTAGFSQAIAKFGLSVRQKEIETRAVELAQVAFDGASVRVQKYAGSSRRVAGPPIMFERMLVDVGDLDPNGLGLLGSDNSPGKDSGNLRLDEQLAGFNELTRQRGRAAYGGVFVGELFAFSRKLHPTSQAADPAFDALFAPFAKELGGDPALAEDSTSAAVEALASLVADTLVHECGHALGMAAGTAGYHHEGDHQNWRMDAGKHRSFAERARLGKQPIWGPVDGAYLAKILPLK